MEGPLLRRGRQRFGFNSLNACATCTKFGYLHCDIKRNNVRIGSNYASRVRLIDLEFCKPYLLAKANHIDYRGRYEVLPSEYSSFSLLCRQTLGRRDDLEPIELCLVFLTEESLPWTASIQRQDGPDSVRRLRKAVARCRNRGLC